MWGFFLEELKHGCSSDPTSCRNVQSRNAKKNSHPSYKLTRNILKQVPRYFQQTECAKLGAFCNICIDADN